MKRRGGATLVALMVAAACPWAAAQVYKCTDAAGKTTYQAQPCADAKVGGAMILEGQPAPRPRPAPAVAPSGFGGFAAPSFAEMDDTAGAPAPRTAAPARRSLPPARVETPWVRIHFDLLGVDGQAMSWTNAGPANRGRSATSFGQVSAEMWVSALALGANGREAYTLGNGGELLWWPQGLNGKSQSLTPPTKLPSLSWVSALAWDTRSGVLAIASQDGEGFFYRYDTRRHAWLGAVSLRNRDLLSLAFDAQTGQYVGLSNELDVVVYDAQGAQQSVTPLAGVLPPGAYNQAAPLSGALAIAARGGVVAIARVSKGVVSHIWTCELAGGRIQLTYKD